MRAKPLWTLLVVLTWAGVAMAQEPAVTSGEEEQPAEPALHIRVLDNPYDLAGFYRSRQQAPFGMQGAPAAGGNPFTNPYAIASYYRSADGPRYYPYEAFWTNGYGARQRNGITIGFRRRIGENGDLYLLAPTFLAHVGPLSGFFLVDR